MEKYLKLFKNRSFTLLFLGQWISDLGSNINILGLSWITLKLTGSVMDVGKMFMFSQLPSIVIGPFAGVWADRLNKKTIILLTDLLRGILSISLFFVAEINYLLFVVFLQSVCDVFFKPAIRGLIPKLVDEEDLMLAGAFSAFIYRISKLLGPAIAGMLMVIFKAEIIFLVNGISFIISAVMEFFIKYEHDNKKELEKTTFMKDFKEGFMYIRDNVTVKFVILFFAIASLAFGSFNMLNVAYLKEEILVSADIYGFLMTAFGGGVLIGSYILTRVGDKFSEIKLIMFGMGIYGALYTIFGLTNIELLLFITFTLCGIFNSIVNISYGVYLQKNVEESKLGRVFSIDMAVGNILVLLSIYITGICAERFSSGIMIVIYGIFLAAISLIGNIFWNQISAKRSAINTL